jgi:gamma-butyrobetaine dioxygenase
MPELTDVKHVAASAETLTIEWADGGVSQFPSLWLRDNRSEDRDAHSGQRLIDVTDLPVSPRIRSARREDGAVRVEWEGESGHSSFALSWLAAHAFGRAARPPEREVRRWLTGAALDAARDFAWASLAELGNDPHVRLGWLTRLLQDGLAFVSALPVTEDAILEAVALVGRVLETNYGLTFDVRSLPQPENLAYSDLGLGLHTDNPYREPVPGFQALHALIPAREGGDSLFADGFALAEQLRVSAPEAFARLTATAVPFHYRAGDVDLYAERPLIELAVSGEVAAVHYNSRSIAPLRLPPQELPRFYDAYRRFAQLLHEPNWQLRTRLEGGTLAVFDNRRTLHGRTPFSSARHARHLRGCYLTRDSVFSETALLRRQLAGRSA